VKARCKKTETFAPVLAERAAFTSTLLQVTPNAPVTPALIAANALMFVIATALGGGLLVSDPAVMIRLGTILSVAPQHHFMNQDHGEKQSATLGLETESVDRTCRKLGVSIHGTQPP
jgi:hypothetical protein